MSNEINSKNILAFFQGNLRFYKSKIVKLAPHIKEQYYYRLYQCKDDCLKTRRCIKCNCPTIKKSLVSSSCNKARFPDLMSNREWQKYKEENNITNINEIINIIENELQQRGV